MGDCKTEEGLSVVCETFGYVCYLNSENPSWNISKMQNLVQN